MEERGKRITILIATLVLIVLILYLIPKTSFLPLTSTSGVGTNEDLDFKTYTISEDKLNTPLTINERDVIILLFNSKQYSFKINNLNETKKEALIEFRNEKIIIPLKVSEPKKIDLNKDDYYDVIFSIESISDKSTTITISKSTEELGLQERIDSRIEGVLLNLQRNYYIQSSLITIILLIFLIILIVYIIKAYIMPIYQKKNTEGQKPSEALDYLIEELYVNKKADKKENVVNLFKRINHLYDHMSETEKKKYKDTLEDIKKYLNEE